jgi:hypothetical protein
MKRLPKRLAQTVAAAAIAVFWCISAVGTTIGTGVGVVGVGAEAVTVGVTTAAIPTTGMVIPTVVEAGVVSGSESGKRVTSQAVAAVVICC